MTVLAASACGSHAAPPAPPPVAERAVPVERRTMAAYESLDGTVDPYLAANLAPQQSGTLTAIYANEGDRVSAGEVLAKIDDSVLRASLDQQVATDAQNAAKLSQSQIQLPITTVASNAALVQARRALDQQRKTQVADRANVASTRLTFAADEQLYRQGFVAASVELQARATYVAAQQTLAADTDRLVQAQSTVAQAQQNLANTPLQRQVIAQNRGAVEQSRGLIEQYRAEVSQTTITAPFDGVVTSRTLDPGSFASPSQAIYSIAQIDPIYIDFNLKDTDLAYVKRGTAVSFATSANPARRYSGVVSAINAVPAAGTLLYRARIVERNPDYALRGGLQVSVRVTTAVHRAALTVPRSAVVQDGSGGTLYAVASHDGHSIAKRLAVRLGLQNAQYVEVSGKSVRPGLPIITNQTDNLHDGLAIATPAPK